MPNYVGNIVNMEGIIELPLFKMKYDEHRKRNVACLDFNTIVPMPESLNVESSSITDEAIIYYVTDKCILPLQAIRKEYIELVEKEVKNTLYEGVWADEVFMSILKRTYDMSAEEKEELYEKGRIYVSNIRNYGYATWYHWCIEHWGTKWNACFNEQEDEDTIIFKTAWSNPEPFMLKLSERYPEAEIEHWWAGEGMGINAGYRVYQKGQIVHGGYYDSYSNEAYETYDMCW